MRRIILISKALIQTAARVMLVGNSVLLVPVVAVGKRKLCCRCSTENDDNRRDRIIMHIKLYLRIECFQFLHHVVNSNILHNVPPGNCHFIMSIPTDVTRLKQCVTSLIIVSYLHKIVNLCCFPFRHSFLIYIHKIIPAVYILKH